MLPLFDNNKLELKWQSGPYSSVTFSLKLDVQFEKLNPILAKQNPNTNCNHNLLWHCLGRFVPDTAAHITHESLTCCGFEKETSNHEMMVTRCWKVKFLLEWWSLQIGNQKGNRARLRASVSSWINISYALNTALTLAVLIILPRLCSAPSREDFRLGKLSKKTQVRQRELTLEVEVKCSDRVCIEPLHFPPFWHLAA